MSHLFYQPHVHSFESHDVNFTPRLQCAIPPSSLLNFPLSAAMFTFDSRTPNALVVDLTEHNIDHITSLERSLCSNFFCCGVQLADFHALLEHFEQNHVVVLAPNGKRVYPREGLRAVPLDPASGSSTPSSSRASSVTPASPLTPQTPLSPSPSFSLSPLPAVTPPASRKSSFTMPPVYTPFTPSLPVDPANPILDSSEIVMSQEPAFDFSVHPNIFPPLTPDITSEPSSSSEDEGGSECSTAAHGNRASGIADHDMSERPLNVRFISPTGGEKRKHSSKSSKSRRHHPSGGSHSKRREKMYRCPKNGCVKAYLNPNGLKYHLEKGTCKFAEDEDEPSLERAVPPKRSSTPMRNAYPSPSAPLPNFTERSAVNTMINDSDRGDVSQPHSHVAAPSVGPSSSNNYVHTPVPAWEAPHIENQCPHPYSYPVEVPTQHFKCEEREEYSPSSPPAPSVLPLPPQAVPQYGTQQQQVPFHYPVPTYPNGYMYAQRSYFASELAKYETSASVLANYGVAPSISQ